MAERPNRLRYLRRVADLTQEQLAERAGVHPQTVSDLERGRYRPTLETAAALARELGCSVEDLFLPSGSGDAPDISSHADVGDRAAAAAVAPSRAVVAGEQPPDGTAAQPAAGHRDEDGG